MKNKNFTGENLEEALSRWVDKIYPTREVFLAVIQGGKKLVIYIGVDPTGPHLHLGHMTNFLILKRFQDLGHKIIFLIGDFTAQIGDPSGKDSARQQLSASEVKKNFKTFKSQAEKIISFAGKNKAEVMFNSKWHGKMKFSEVMKLASNFTVQQMIERDMFQGRIKARKPIGLHEFFYPLIQGYDSVAMNVDAEIGGTDQTFNMLMGRSLMKVYKNREKFVITTKLLENPKTGRKLMSKSEGGTINLDDAPSDIFGKVMALDDAAMFQVAKLSSEMPLDEVKKLKDEFDGGSINPRDIKARVAKAVVATIYGEKESQKAEENFTKIFSKKDLSGDLPVLKLKAKISAADLVLLSKVVSSKAQAWRLVEQGGFSLDGKVLKNPREELLLKGGEVVKIGKRSFFKVAI